MSVKQLTFTAKVEGDKVEYNLYKEGFTSLEAMGILLSEAIAINPARTNSPKRKLAKKKKVVE